MDISSVHNERVKAVAKLARARTRREQGQHLVEGPNAVIEAATAGVVDEVFVAASYADRHHLGDVSVTQVADEVMAKMADSATPQGIVAVARTQTAALADVAGGFVVVLDQVADPGNAGTILRTADAAGADAVVFTRGSVDPFGPKSVRAAAGSTYHLPVVTEVTIAQVHAAADACGQRLYGLDATGTGTIQQLEVRQQTPPVLVLSNEAQGLSDQTRAHMDALVSIPMPGQAESLNVAAAAAIAIYAVSRGVHPQPTSGQTGRGIRP